MSRPSTGGGPIPKRHMAEEGTESWLMSYADMITLLMCFFIIFVSVSEPKKDRLAAVTEGMSSQFGRMELSSPYLGTYRQLQGVVERYEAFNDMVVEKTENGVQMEFSSGSFFEPGTAKIDPAKLPLLGEIVAALKSAGFAQYNVIVEGHTDDEKTDNALFPSNWELSSARASRVIRLMADAGMDTGRMRAVGYAGTRPLVPHRDAQGKSIAENREKNQRIVIKLERVM